MTISFPTPRSWQWLQQRSPAAATAHGVAIPNALYAITLSESQSFRDRFPVDRPDGADRFVHWCLTRAPELYPGAVASVADALAAALNTPAGGGSSLSWL